MGKGVYFFKLTLDKSLISETLTDNTIEKIDQMIERVLSTKVENDNNKYSKAISEKPIKNKKVWVSQLLGKISSLYYQYHRTNNRKNIPKEKNGDVSSLVLLDIEDEETKENSVYQRLSISYFYNGPESFRGVLDTGEGYDVYLFEGFSREKVEECVNELVEYWNLTRMEQTIIVEVLHIYEDKKQIIMGIETIPYDTELVEISIEPPIKLSIEEKNQGEELPYKIKSYSPIQIYIKGKFEEGVNYNLLFKILMGEETFFGEKDLKL